MAVNVNNHRAEGVPRCLSIDASSSTAEGTRYVFSRPMKDWGLQVATASTNAIVLLQLGVASSSAAALTTVITWASSDGATSGMTKFSTGVYPASVAAAFLSAGASSNGCSAWLTGM